MLTATHTIKINKGLLLVSIVLFCIPFIKQPDNVQYIAVQDLGDNAIEA